MQYIRDFDSHFQADLLIDLLKQGEILYRSDRGNFCLSKIYSAVIQNPWLEATLGTIFYLRVYLKGVSIICY